MKAIRLWHPMFLSLNTDAYHMLLGRLTGKFRNTGINGRGFSAKVNHRPTRFFLLLPSLIYQANAFYLTVFSSSSSEQHYTLFPDCSLLLPAHRGCPSFGAPPFLGVPVIIVNLHRPPLLGIS